MKDANGPLEDALSRWSRRKADARKGRRGAAAPQVADTADRQGRPSPAADETATPPAGPAAAGTEPPARSETLAAALADPDRPLGDEEATALAAELDLPAIEELTAESDYRGFLAKGVPAALTRAALRKLWASDPVFANLDRLNEYDEDYRAMNAAHEVVQTAYRVGKGFLDDTPADETDRDAEETGADTGDDDTLAQRQDSAPDGGETAMDRERDESAKADADPDEDRRSGEEPDATG